MPKLDLTRAQAIKTASGELAELKGPQFSWLKPAAPPPSGGVWTPTTDATLAAKIAAWLDFSDAATMTTSGGTITSITDKALGHVFAPLHAASAPLIGTLDGKSALALGEGYLVAPAATNYPAGGGFVGVTFGSNPGYDFEEWAGVTNPTRGLFINPRAALIWGYGNAYFSGVTSVDETNVFAIALPIDAALIDGLVHVDGSKVVYASGNNSSRTMSALTSAPVDLQVGGPNPPATSRLGEIIFLLDDLTALERQKLEGYLAHKWGTEAKLPASHPYKAAAPS